MFANLKKIAVSAVVGLSVLASVPATAQAHQVQVGGGGAGFGIWFGDSGHSQWRHGHRRHRHWDKRHHNRRHGHVRRCSVRRAINKAHRMGVNRPRVRFANERVIKIKGRSHGHRVRILFSRAPGCPVLRY